MERVEKAELELTAIVEPAARMGATDEEPERLELYRFAVETMEEHGIRVLTTERLAAWRRRRGGSCGCSREQGAESRECSPAWRSNSTLRFRNWTGSAFFAHR